MSHEEKIHHSHTPGEKCAVCEISVWHAKRYAPWISRVFDAMGLVFIAVG